MLSSDDVAQTTEPLEPLPQLFDRRSTLSKRRQRILQKKQNEKHTDYLPSLTEEPGAKLARRQVTQLREENRHLRSALEEQRRNLQRLMVDYDKLQEELEQEVAAIHVGHLQEVEHYRSHMREMMAERNRLQESSHQLEQRYQELSSSFQCAVEEEARALVTEAAHTLELSPENVPLVLQEVVETLKLHAKQLEDKHLVEVLYLKHEGQHITAQLRQERQELEEERQRLLTLQHTVREQAKLRHRVLQEHLRTRWLFAFAFVTTGVLVLLVVLQLFFLSLFHVPFSGLLSFSLFAPIVICGALSIISTHPLSIMKHAYTSAPHKKAVKKST